MFRNNWWNRSRNKKYYKSWKWSKRIGWTEVELEIQVETGIEVGIVVIKKNKKNIEIGIIGGMIEV